MNIGVQMFAALREIAGDSRVEIDLPTGAHTGALLELLLSRYPAMLPWKDHLRMAVNREYVGMNHPLHESDEVAVIPPVSGG